MLLEWLRLGGVPMWLLMLLSIAAATTAIVKLWELWEWRFTGLARDWRQQRADLAIAQLGRERSPLAAVLATAVAALNDDAVSEAQARERTELVAAAALERMRGGLRTLELIAQLAPLLGLFGTVLGLIGEFRMLQQSGSGLQLDTVAGGIWPSLLTTAVGFAIAMPVIVVVHVLERIVDGQRQALEAALTQLFTQPRAGRRHAS